QVEIEEAVTHHRPGRRRADAAAARAADHRVVFGVAVDVVDARQADHADQFAGVGQRDGAAHFAAAAQYVVVVPLQVDVEPDQAAGGAGTVRNVRIPPPRVYDRGAFPGDLTELDVAHT